MISKYQRNKTVKRRLNLKVDKIFTSVVLYLLRKLALFVASTTENMDKIGKYYGENHILGFII